MCAAQTTCSERMSPIRCEDFEEDPSNIPPEIFNLEVVPPGDTVGVVREVAEVTHLRLVGDLALHTNLLATPSAGEEHNSAIVHWHVGVNFADVDPQTGLPCAPVQSPATAYDAETKDWLYRWHHAETLHVARSSAGSPWFQRAVHSVNHHIDINVKRKLRRDEGLWLFVHMLFEDMGSSTAVTASNFIGALTANLRSLIVLP